MNHRRPLAIAIAVAAVSAAALPALVAFGAPGDQLPDLVADPPENPYLEVYGGTGTPALLLRFDGFVHNIGPGAFEMKGTDPDGQPNPTMTKVQQIVYPAGGGTPTALPSAAAIKFEPQDGHDHFHLKDAAAYSLWNSARTAEVAPGMKVGFCLEDTEPVESEENSVYDNLSFCQQGNPGASSVDMGVSAGWRDVYNSGLAFQWVDVSDVPPGSTGSARTSTRTT